jgi:hypothetical protein
VLHGSEPWALAERRCGPHGRAPPGRHEPQLEPPGGWGRHWGASAAAEQLAAEPILGASEPPSASSVLGQRCVRCFSVLIWACAHS